MKYREYTDDEIVLLVKAYIKRKCDNCHFADSGVPCGSCFIAAIRGSINLITRQKAKIERLYKEIERISKMTVETNVKEMTEGENQ